MERNWNLFDLLLERVGGDDLSLAICKALSSDDMNDTLEYIARCYDLQEDIDND